VRRRNRQHTFSVYILALPAWDSAVVGFCRIDTAKRWWRWA